MGNIYNLITYIISEPVFILEYPSAIQNLLPKFTWSIFNPCVCPGMFLQVFLSKKQENKIFFQSAYFTRNVSQILSRLKLNIVNTMKFRLLLGPMRGYKY